jgi:hypothetical protein
MPRLCPIHLAGSQIQRDAYRVVGMRDEILHVAAVQIRPLVLVISWRGI